MVLHLCYTLLALYCWCLQVKHFSNVHSLYFTFPVLHYLSIKLQEPLGRCEKHGCGGANKLCNCFFKVAALISVLAIFGVTILVRSIKHFHIYNIWTLRNVQCLLGIYCCVWIFQSLEQSWFGEGYNRRPKLLPVCLDDIFICFAHSLLDLYST